LDLGGLLGHDGGGLREWRGLVNAGEESWSPRHLDSRGIGDKTKE
jgi:hypothetical protein